MRPNIEESTTADDSAMTMLLVMMYRAGLTEVSTTEDEITAAVAYYRKQNQGFWVDDLDGEKGGIVIKVMDKDHMTMLSDLDDDENNTIN